MEMNLRKYLNEEVKKYQNVIIYGYRDIGTCVLDYLIQLETDIKTSNYSGRVKFFATSSILESAHEKKGIPIRHIGDLQEYAKDALVIIAMQEQHHGIVSELLDTYGFFNRIYMTHEMYIELKEIVGNYTRQIDNQVRQYSMQHEMKIERLRRKIASGKKAKVFFMTQHAAAFGAATVYKAMEKSEYFEPYIFCISKRDLWYKDFYAAVEADVKFFEERGFRAIHGYDNNHTAKDITKLNPDIIFWDSPNLYGPANNSHFRLDMLNWKYLTCYIPYGLLMVDSFYYHYNNINCRTCWKHFMDTDASYDRALAEAEFNGLNIVKGGYPKFDDYFSKKDILPEKLQNEKRTVIYAPHWSLDIENNFATFDLYKDIFMNLVKTHPEINFVFKPHPELEHRIKARFSLGKSEFSHADYMKYIEEWNSQPNGCAVLQGDYVGVFKRSDCMITDCGSFIGEYLPSQNACVYLFNPRKNHQEDAYTPLARKILDTYYVVRTEEELKSAIEEIVIAGKDVKKQMRKELLESEFSNIGHAGQDIVDYLTDQILDNE